MYLRKEDDLEIKWNPEDLNLAKQAISEVLKKDITLIDEEKYIGVSDEIATQINIKYSELEEIKYPSEEKVEEDKVKFLEEQVGSIIFEDVINKTKISDLEIQNGNLMLEIAMLKTGGAL